MSLTALTMLAALFAGGGDAAESPVGDGTAPPVVELGLTSPLEELEDVESFGRELAERLVWTVRGEHREAVREKVSVRFTAVRLERGRVTASFQSDAREASDGLDRIAESLGMEAFMAFPDVCFSSEDPPAVVRALSGDARLDGEALERAIADAARTRDIDRLFGLDRPLDIEWGRHAVLVLAAVSEDPELLVRPLILVVERM